MRALKDAKLVLVPGTFIEACAMAVRHKSDSQGMEHSTSEALNGESGPPVLLR
jgi:hypothetical protein